MKILNTPFAAYLLSCVTLFSTTVFANTNNKLDTVTVTAQRVANDRPAGTLESPVTLLRFDPIVDVQTRGLAETQADIVVRGGIFENTGFKVGAVNLFDPQTGHYSAELPFDSQALNPAILHTGIDNALAGFNSNVATIAYTLTPILDRRSVSLGGGSDSLGFGHIFMSQQFSEENDPELGASIAYSHSRGDGSRDNGDHDIERVTARLQRTSETGTSDAVITWQDKFFGWPGMYTGFSSLPETDHTKTKLLLLNHHQATSNESWWEMGAYYRSLEDDYDFDRTTLERHAPGSFDHKTRSYAVGIQGVQLYRTWHWHYNAQLTGDRLVRSTDLLNGDFSKRQYLSTSILPSKRWRTRAGNSAQLSFGATIDWSNEDSTELLPLLGVSLTRDNSAVATTYSIDYSATTQLPGYTALKSGVSGLFGGNPELSRERADTVQLKVVRKTSSTEASVTAFVRQDENLVDWTYSSDSPFARQANPVDIEVLGIELFWRRQFNQLVLVTGYSWLDKDADYQSNLVDASFYALNYASHRLTTAAIWRPSATFEWRLDAESRKQQDNALRTSSNNAFELSTSVVWWPSIWSGVRIDLVADNLTNSNFQEFPGSLSTRRQLSLRIEKSW